MWGVMRLGETMMKAGTNSWEVATGGKVTGGISLDD
jgi:hypothetical protein